MDSETRIKDIKLIASANFYQINEAENVDEAKWSLIVNAIRSNIPNPAQNVYSTEWESEQLVDGKNVHYGLCVFRYQATRPTFAKDIFGYWEERKLGYFLIVEHERYVAIQSRHMEVPEVLLGILKPIDYHTLTALNNNSSYSKISMKNLDGGVNAMRARTFIADDLSRSMPTMGTSHYVLSAFNGKNDDGKTFTVTTSTSHIAKRAQNISINTYCTWVEETINKLRSGNQNRSTDLLSTFADYVDYKSENQNNNLTPMSILISAWDIKDKLEEAECSLTYKYNGKIRTINLSSLLAVIESQLREAISLTQDGDRYSNIEKHLSVVLLEDKIVLESEKLQNVWICSQKRKEYNLSLEKLINRYGLFNVYFANTGLIYTQGGLYRNHNLLNSATKILDIFDDTLDGIADVKFEKGPDKSIFKIIESTFNQGDRYLICNDFGTEWADHILLEEGKVTFFEEKYSEHKRSASDFQVVIGQALKNLGYFTPTDADLAAQQKRWAKDYPQTQAPRLIHADGNKTIQDAMNLWKANTKNPLFERKMCLVVNFISRSGFKVDIENAQNNAIMDTHIKATTFQRIWILTSFVNACMEVGVTPKIYCKP